MAFKVKEMSENRPRVWQAFAFLILIGGLLVWWVNSLPNEDPLWFLRTFTHKASWIVIYHEGTTTMLFPGDQHYDGIMTTFSDGISHWKGYEGGVGLSDENLERYRSEFDMLELHFNKPVKVHTRHLYSEARNFFVPLSGSHAEYFRVFAGLTDKPRIGVLNMHEEKFTALQDAVTLAIRE
jgi:hypothetical protein